MRNDGYTLRFGAELLPTMLRAVALQRNCVLGDTTGLRAALDAQYDELVRQSGVPNLRHVVEDAAWFEACAAIAVASAYYWYIERSRIRDVARLSLVVDGREHRLARGGPSPDDPVAPAIRDLLERHAHPDAVRGDDIENWRSYRAFEAEAGPRP